MMRKLSPELAHSLAAEYVLGTLRGGARRRFAAALATDEQLAGIVARWQQELTPMAEKLGSVEPPARVWKAIEARIAPSRASGSVWSSLGFWRSFGMVAAGAAAVLLAAVLRLAPAPSAEPQLVAVLTSPDNAPRMIVTLQGADELRVQAVKPWKNIEGKALELWALPKEGAPRSLGLVANEGETTIRIAASDARMQGANSFAISLEPPGGSPSKAPTGPVLCAGAIAPMRRS